MTKCYENPHGWALLRVLIGQRALLGGDPKPRCQGWRPPGEGVEQAAPQAKAAADDLNVRSLTD